MMGAGIGIGVVLVIFWAVLILAAVWLAKMLFPGSSSSGRPEPSRPPTPREILEQRYARGEISRAEFELIRQDLA